MANLPVSLAQSAEQAFNGKDTCITIDSEGNVVTTEWNKWGRILRWDVATEQ